MSTVENGGNYGRNVREGTHWFSTANPSEEPGPDECPKKVASGPRADEDEELLDPVIEYRHRRSTTAPIDGSVVIGGSVYDDSAVGGIREKYVFGNWSGDGVIRPDGEIFAATPPSPQDESDLWSIEELRIAETDNGRLNRYVLAFGRDHDGELSVLTTENFTPTGGTGAVHRLVSPEDAEGSSR
ncbi:hypothetical protein BRC94_10810 [Halobacteriales archaeon QS_5_70_17]|nr:MAG: hypothetical protein BRC94_10810 [Halobacteriales archaeon QS_5_70_17]